MRQPHAYSESECDFHSDRNRDADGHVYAYRNGHADGNIHANGYRNSHRYSYTNSNGYGNCDRNAAGYTYATAAAHTAAASGQLLFG